MHHVAQRHLEEARPEVVEGADVAGAEEAVLPLVDAWVGEGAVLEGVLDAAGNRGA